MLIRDAFTEFILACRADGFAPTTIKWYKNLLSFGPYNVLDWLEARRVRQLKQVTTSHLREYIAWMRQQPNIHTGEPRSVYSVNAVLRCLHRFFHWCADEYQLPNPMGRIRYPKNPKPQPKAIKLETAVALINACGGDVYGVRNRAMLLFFLSTGARREGVATLLTERLDLETRRAVVIEKGNKPRVVPFDHLTAEAINDWLHVREPLPTLFYNIRTREPLTGGGIRTIIQKIARNAGVTEKTNPHGWRHLFAELYNQAGGQIPILSKIMGHESTSVTADIYLNFELQSALEDYDLRNPMEPVKKLLKTKNPDR